MAASSSPIFRESFALSTAELPGFSFTADLAVDRGCSLTKVAVRRTVGDAQACQIECLTFRNSDFEAALAWLRSTAESLGIDLVRATGAGGHALFQQIADGLGGKIRVEVVEEHACQTRGTFLVLKRGNGNEIFHPPSLAEEEDEATDAETEDSLIFFIGSGTGVVHVDNQGKATNVGGTCFGGKIMLGLSQALLGHSDYDTLMGQAAAGDGDRLTVKAKDVMRTDPEGPYRMLDPEFPLFPFGKMAEQGLCGEDVDPENLSNTLITMVMLPIVSKIVQLCIAYEFHPRVVIVGNTARAEHFRRSLSEMMQVHAQIFKKKIRHRYVRTGHTGAIGALVTDPTIKVVD